MPKIVDHEARREEIVEAVWTLVAREGFAALTMRDLAAEVGLANGALARYFPTKDSILRAAFQRAYDATNRRAEATIGDRSGLEAFRLLCVEIMPLDAERLDESRVVIGFWDYAAADAELVAVYDEAMAQWRERMTSYLGFGQSVGEVAHGVDLETSIDLVMAALMGLQINAVFSAAATTPERQLRILDAVLDGLRAGRPRR